MKAYITVGVSGSGKTTWGKKQSGFEIISRDDIRAAIVLDTTGKEMTSWKQWSFKNEDRVSAIQEGMVHRARTSCKDIILADTNLNKPRAKKLASDLERIGYEVEFKFFHGRNSEEDVDIDECIKRDAARTMSVGAHVIHKQWKQMIDSWGDDIFEQYIRPMRCPKAIVVDIDGTVADHTGVRSPFDWAAVGKDKPRKEIIKLVNAMGELYKVIFLSGRDAVCKAATEQWLEDNVGVCVEHLYMRAEGDCRKDSEIKTELFDKYIRHNYNVVMVFDDRKQMVQRWSDLGLTVINVGHINDYF